MSESEHEREAHIDAPVFLSDGRTSRRAEIHVRRDPFVAWLTVWEIGDDDRRRFKTTVRLSNQQALALAQVITPPADEMLPAGRTIDPPLIVGKQPGSSATGRIHRT